MMNKLSTDYLVHLGKHKEISSNETIVFVKCILVCVRFEVIKNKKSILGYRNYSQIRTCFIWYQISINHFHFFFIQLPLNLKIQISFSQLFECMRI